MTSRALTVEAYVCRPSLSPEREEVDAIVFESATAQRRWRLARILHDNGASDGLDEALGHVESGETEGLVVARLADMGSNLSEAVAAIDRIRAAGGTLLSVSDGIELGADTGQVSWRLLVSLAEWR